MQGLGLTKYQRREPISKKIVSSYQHQSGFRIDVLPRDGFSQKYLSLVIPYGSAYTRFIDPRSNEEVELPLGTINLLAAIIFTYSAEGTLASELEKIGIVPKLDVGHSSIIFEMSTVDFLPNAAELILEKFREFELTEEVIAAVKSRVLRKVSALKSRSDYFIEKEIRSAIYKAPEIFTPVLGTKASVKAITLEDLQLCLDNLFSPHNISFVLAGEFDEDFVVNRMARQMSEFDDRAEESKIKRTELEREDIVRKKIVSWDRPNSAFAIVYRFDSTYKPYSRGGKDNLKLNMEANIVMDMLIGPFTEAFEDIRGTGLLGDKINYQLNVDDDIAFLEMSGNSINPELTVDVITEKLESLISDGYYDAEIFDMSWNATVGHFIREVDSISEYGHAASLARINNIDFVDYSTIFKEVKSKESAVLESLNFIRAENRAVLICNSK